MANLKKPSNAQRGKSSRTLDRTTFGKRLRAARKQQALTLAEVAGLSDVSITTISRAERGQLALSYEKFSALGRALRMDMAAMFSLVDATTSRLDQPVVTRAGEGVMYRGQTISYEFLGTGAAGKQMSPIIGTVHARCVNGPEDYARHEGEEFVHVLSGAIEVHFDGAEVVRLARGDSLYFDSRRGHAYISVSRRLSRVVGACTSESSLAKFAHEQAAAQASRSISERLKKSKPGVTGLLRQSTVRKK